MIVAEVTNSFWKLPLVFFYLIGKEDTRIGYSVILSLQNGALFLQKVALFLQMLVLLLRYLEKRAVDDKANEADSGHP